MVASDVVWFIKIVKQENFIQMKNKNRNLFAIPTYPTKKKHIIKSKKGSYTSMGFDTRSIASENIRRTSLAKLSALPLEAPITKVTYSVLLRSFQIQC